MHFPKPTNEIFLLFAHKTKQIKKTSKLFWFSVQLLIFLWNAENVWSRICGDYLGNVEEFWVCWRFSLKLQAFEKENLKLSKLYFKFQPYQTLQIFFLPNFTSIPSKAQRSSSKFLILNFIKLKRKKVV